MPLYHLVFPRTMSDVRGAALCTCRPSVGNASASSWIQEQVFEITEIHVLHLNYPCLPHGRTFEGLRTKVVSSDNLETRNSPFVVLVICHLPCPYIRGAKALEKVLRKALLVMNIKAISSKSIQCRICPYSVPVFEHKLSLLEGLQSSHSNHNQTNAIPCTTAVS